MKKQYTKSSVDIIKMSKEEVNEDLEKEIHNQAMKLHTAPTYEELRRFALHFVNWQKEQDQKTIELAEDHAMLAGMEKMKEEMLKDAISCKVFWHDMPLLDYTQEQQDEALERIGADVGDKVKLIIIKDET